ncbi:MAG: hypothetical protein DA408_17955 [Bacteroidetes bacterium]|nr:MAG: hypothetical protein C7N36_15970 [Bacteroidota bacterium]PTM09583.1 MAG: hypothetical protein DA408_17955 [Bacteroidota bacterium]
MKTWLFSLAILLGTSAFAQGKINNFTRLEIDGPLIVDLIVSDQPGIIATQEADLVTWEVNGDALVVMARYREGRETARVAIRVPELAALETTGAVILTGKGVLVTRKLSVRLSGQSVVDLEIDVETLTANLRSQSILTLKGSADAFQLSADQQSVAHVQGVVSGELDVNADHQSVVTIQRGNAKVALSTQHQSVVVE